MSRIIETITKQIPPDPWITDPEVENLCCEIVDVPVCKEKIEPWRGYTQEEILERLDIDVDDSGRDAAGNIIEVRLKNDNPSGLCGEQVTKQVENPKACCDGVTQIVWDDANSVEVIADNSSGYVYVTGGRPPYTWSVRGNGFWFNSVGTIRDAETDEPWIRIFTLDSCGPCVVAVTDGCSDVTDYVRSTIGQWELVGSFYSDEKSVLMTEFPEIFEDISNSYVWDTTIPAYAESGIFRLSLYSTSPLDRGDTYRGLTWGRFQGSSCIQHLTIQYYKDPILGIFDIPGISSSIKVGTDYRCGGGTKYRVGSYRPDSALKILKWSC